MGSSSSKAKATADSSLTANAAFVKEPTINNLDDAVIELANCVRDCKDIFKAFVDVFVTVGGVTYFVILPTCFYFSWRSHRKEMDRSAKELEILKKENRKRNDETRKELDEARKRLDNDRLERLREQQKSHPAATPSPSGVRVINIDEQTYHSAATQQTSHSAAPPPLPPSSPSSSEGGMVEDVLEEVLSFVHHETSNGGLL